MRANLQIGSEENMFVNVLEIFNKFSLKISLCRIAKLISSIEIEIIMNGMTKSDKSNVDSVFLMDVLQSHADYRKTLKI